MANDHADANHPVSKPSLVVESKQDWRRMRLWKGHKSILQGLSISPVAPGCPGSLDKRASRQWNGSEGSFPLGHTWGRLRPDSKEAPVRTHGLQPGPTHSCPWALGSISALQGERKAEGFSEKFRCLHRPVCLRDRIKDRRNERRAEEI